MKVKSKHQHFTELAMTGEDIKLHIQTEDFSQLDIILKTVEPYGYKVKSLNSYTGAGPNVILYQDIQKLRDIKINQILD